MAARLREPTARGLAAAVSRAIGEGALAPGDKLPPVRTIAAELGLSPTTVSAAWQLLGRAGAIRAEGRRGTVIARPRATGPQRYRRALEHRAGFSLDLSTGVPDPALLPDLGPALGRLHATPLSSYLDTPVLPELEELLRQRWPSPVEQLMVVDGAMDALDLLTASVLKLGDSSIVEDPGFPPLLDLLDASGIRAVGVGLDDEGAVPRLLEQALERGAAAVILQPRAQNPTGTSWSRRRAADLAAVLRDAPSTVVIEDAGDIASTPGLSLGEWLPERTVHIASFAKSHGPDLRLAAVGGPAALLSPVAERRLLGQGWTSRLLQHLLLDLLTDPSSVAQVRKAADEYARRRAAVVSSLRTHGVRLPDGSALPDGEGINLWLPVRDEQAALIWLASHGIAAAAGTGFVVDDPRPAVRVTVGLVAGDHEGLAAALAHATRVGRGQPPR
jgi:DNA-binding transcriptional MocR family regulator